MTHACTMYNVHTRYVSNIVFRHRKNLGNHQEITVIFYFDVHSCVGRLSFNAHIPHSIVNRRLLSCIIALKTCRYDTCNMYKVFIQNNNELFCFPLCGCCQMSLLRYTRFGMQRRLFSPLFFQLSATDSYYVAIIILMGVDAMQTVDPNVT